MTPLGALLRSRWITTRRWLGSVRSESRLKVAMVGSAALATWLALFALVYAVLRLFERFAADVLRGGDAWLLTDLIVQRLLAVFALTVLGLLVVSNVLVSFATFYRAREVAFLLQTPIPPATFFLSRQLEVVAFSSWALGFLGAPALIAYGVVRDAQWPYFVALPLFFLPFVAIPAAVGSALTALLVRLFATSRRSLLILGALVTSAALIAFARERVTLPDLGQAESVRAVVDLMSRAQSPYLPSAWLADGLLAAASGRLADAAFLLLVLAANAIFLTWLAALVHEGIFYRGWTDVTSGGAPSRAAQHRGHARRGLLERLSSAWSEPHRSLVLKDLRMFWRDPAQWSQFLLFFGLIAVYVANLENRGALSAEPWRSWISILNTSAVLLVLATLTTRFVYPLISLEGRRFWILGLAPLERRSLVRQKFWLSVTCTSVLTVGIATISGFRLELQPGELAFSITAILAATAALSGLAVGLGSLYPNFTEDNPSRIVSGLGGTLNFILSFLFIAAVTTIQAFAVQWHRATGEGGGSAFLWASVAVVVLALITSELALRLGTRNLERCEL